MIYRKATEEDLESISSIEQRVMTMAWTYQSFAEALSQNYTLFYVCEIDGIIAGYGIFYLMPPEAELPDIVVAEEFRRQGIARGLLEILLAKAKEAGVSDVFLEVRINNESAEKLYRSFGFEETGIRKNFYRDPVEDARCMHLSM